MQHNSRTVTLRLERRDVCDLLLALTLVAGESDATKWRKLHDRIKGVLDSFDRQHDMQ